MNAPKRLVYLHGFRSSPQSMKAKKVMAYMQTHHPETAVYCPALPASPALAAEQVHAWVTAQGLAPLSSTCSQAEQRARLDEVAWMGSSLGGYYASWAAERWGGRAVLLNPAVHPYDDLVSHIGRHTLYFSDEEMEFLPAYLDELRALDTQVLRFPLNFGLLACMGDEVLDARLMLAKYPNAQQWVDPAGDHAISGFDDYIESVMTWLGFAPGPSKHSAATQSCGSAGRS